MFKITIEVTTGTEVNKASTISFDILSSSTLDLIKSEIKRVYNTTSKENIEIL